MTSSITYMVITAVLSLCGYSEENRLGYIYAGLVFMLFIYGEFIFDSLIPLAIAAFLLFIYTFGIILENPDHK